MFYGDQETAFSQMRASYGPFGGLMAGGAYAQMGGMGGMGGYYGPSGAYPDDSPMGALGQVGSMLRPATYMPPARVFVQPSGQYVQPQLTIGQSFGTMIGWNGSPRNVSNLEYRMNAATDFAERAGTAGLAGLTTAGGVAAGALLSPVGSAVGSVAGRYLGAGVGGALGSLLGPVGTLAGGAVGSVVGGLAGNLAGGLAAYGLGTTASATALDLVNQQRAMRNFLETTSFRYATASTDFADPRFASGMGTKARGKVAEMITEMDVKDPFLNSDELTRIMQGATGMGLMNNTRTMDEFKRKFKDITENVKVLARTLNTTLEEGLKVMKDFRGIGITDAGEVSRMTLRADSMGRVAGKTAREMLEVGMQGAEMYRGTGISMDIGFQAAQMNAASIRAARDAGVLSQEAVAQAGGEEALAQRMTAGGVGFLQSAVGRGTMAGFYMGGKFNAGAFQDFLGGKVGVPELAMQAARNLGRPEDLIAYQARQEKILSEAGKRFGGMAPQLTEMSSAMMNAKYLQQQMPGLAMEDAFRYTLKTMGKSEPEIDTMVATIGNAQKEFEAKQKGAAATRDKEVAERAYSNFFFTRTYDKLIKDPITSLKNVIAAPINRVVDNLVEWQKNVWERQGLGLERGTVEGMDLSLGEVPKPSDIKNQMVGGLLFSKGQVDLDTGGALAQTAGEKIAGMSSAIERNFGIRAGRASRDANAEEVVVDRRPGVRTAAFAAATLLTGGIVGVAAADAVGDVSYKKAEIARIYNVSRRTYAAEEDIGRLITDEKGQRTEEFQKASTAALARATKADTSKMSGLELMKFLSGKTNEKELNKLDYAVAMDFAKKREGNELKAMEEYSAIASEAVTLGSAVTVEAMQKAKAGFSEAQKNITDSLFSDFNADQKKKTFGMGGGAISSLFQKKAPEFSQEEFNQLLQAKTEGDPQKKEVLLNQLALSVSKATGQSLEESKEYLATRIDKIDMSKAKEALSQAKIIQQSRWITTKTESLGSSAEKLKGVGREAITRVQDTLAKGDISGFVVSALSAEKQLVESGDAATVEQAKTLDSVRRAADNFKNSTDKNKDAYLSHELGKINSLTKDQISKYTSAIKSGMDVDAIQRDVLQTMVETETGKTQISGGGGEFQGGGGSPQEAYDTQTKINREILGILQSLQVQMARR